MDELEPFRRAAELGCPDFAVDSKGVMFQSYDRVYSLPAVLGPLPFNIDPKHVNRYTAAVCAEWWASDGARFVHPHTTTTMIAQARAFAKKYGGQ